RAVRSVSASPAATSSTNAAEMYPKLFWIASASQAFAWNALAKVIGSGDVSSHMRRSFFFFFFQAEDGIRDWSVTGVQTCALPIYRRADLRCCRFPADRPSAWAVSLPRRRGSAAGAAQIGRAAWRGRGERGGGGGVCRKKSKKERGDRRGGGGGWRWAQRSKRRGRR